MSLITKQKPVAPAAREMIERMIEARLKASGLERVVVEPALDHDDDPALFIHVYIGYSPQPLDLRPFLGLGADIGRALSATEEERFPYTRYHFDELQEVTSA